MNYPYETGSSLVEGTSITASFFSSLGNGAVELVEGYEFSSSSSGSSLSTVSSESSISSSSMSSSSMSSSSVSSVSSSMSSISSSSQSSITSVSTLSSSMSSQTSESSTARFHVDYYVSTTGSDLNDGLTPLTARATIQSAVNDCLAGKTVHVLAGTYVLSSQVTVNKAITVSGEAAFSTIVDGNGLNRGFAISGGATITDMTIRNGRGDDFGGGVRCVGATIVRCILSGNVCRRVTVTFGGGGASLESGGIIRDSLVIGNSTVIGHGGGIFVGSGNGYIYNCTVCKNSSPGGNASGISFLGGGVVANTVSVLNIDGPDYGTFGGSPTTASFLYGPEVNARFVDHPNGDYHILSTSPCRNAGNMGYVYSTLDLDKRPRVNEGMVDIGAYEFDPTSMYASVYVSPTGSDSNSGSSPSSPKLTIAGGVAVCLPRGTVYLAAGTYVVSSPVVVQGIGVEGASPTTTIVQGPAPSGASACFELRAESPEYVAGLRNLTVTKGTNSGIRVYTTAGQVCQVTVERCIVHTNTCSGNGGGIYIDRTDGLVQVLASLAYNNIAVGYGGGIYCNNTRAVVIGNCTASKNIASRGGGVYFSGSGASGGLFDSISYYNSTDDVYVSNPTSAGAWTSDIGSDPSSIVKLYCINSPPMFDNSTGPLVSDYDFRLQSTSPCKNTANNYSGIYATLDLAGNDYGADGWNDMGAYEYVDLESSSSSDSSVSSISSISSASSSTQSPSSGSSPSSSSDSTSMSSSVSTVVLVDTSGYVAAYFSNWVINGADYSNTDGGKLYLAFNVDPYPGSGFQSVNLYKDGSRTLLVARGVRAGTVGSITLDEANGSGLSGTVYQITGYLSMYGGDISVPFI